METKPKALKKFASRIMALLMAFALAVTVIPAGNVDAWAAVKKPGTVKKPTAKVVSGTGPVSIKISWKKVKNATGYKVEIWDAHSLKTVKKLKTKKTSLTLKKQKVNDNTNNGTRYFIEIQAYRKSGKKNVYGKKIEYCVKAHWASDPGKSKNKGNKLKTEYKRYISVNAFAVKKHTDNPYAEFILDNIVDNEYKLNTKFKGSKYDAYKSGRGNNDILIKIAADIMDKAGVKYEIRKISEVAQENDYIEFAQAVTGEYCICGKDINGDKCAFAFMDQSGAWNSADPDKRLFSIEIK